MNDTARAGVWSEFNGPNDQIGGTHRWQSVLLDVVEQYYAQAPHRVLLTAALLHKAKSLLAPTAEAVSDEFTDYLCCSISQVTGESPSSCPVRAQMQEVLHDARIHLDGGGFHYLRVHGYDYSAVPWNRLDQVARHWVIDRMIEIAERTGNA